MSLERVLRDEAELIGLSLEEEFEMTTTEFIGPDGSILLHEHDRDTCQCDECQETHWQRVEKESRRGQGRPCPYCGYLDCRCGKRRQDTNAAIKAIARENARRVMKEIIRWHTDEVPFCDDPECPCHSDQILIFSYLKQPLSAGLLNVIEANRLWRGETV